VARIETKSPQLGQGYQD